MLTALGARAVTLMMLMYVLEQSDRRYTIGFACACLPSAHKGSSLEHGRLAVEMIWAAIDRGSSSTTARPQPER
jgi:hypothetical protein